MTSKRKIIDKNGVQVFPITHTKAVLDDNGNSVEQRLQENLDLINQKQLEVGAVPSDLTPTAGSTNWVTSGGVYETISKSYDYILPISRDNLRKCYINASGQWYNVTYRHIIIPVSQGDSFYVQSNDTKMFTYAWLTNNSAPAHQANAPLVTGTTRMQIGVNESDSISAPAGANYMYILLGETQNEALDGQYKPAVFKKYQLVREKVDELEPVISLVPSLNERDQRSRKFEGFIANLTLRDGTPYDVSNTKRVAGKYVQSVSPYGRKLIIFYTDRPNSEGCVYRWGFRTYSTSSGLTSSSANRAATVRYKTPTFGSKENYLKLQPDEKGWAVDIAEYNEKTGELQTLRESDFEDYTFYAFTMMADFDMIYDYQKRGVLELNPAYEIVQKLYSAKKPYYTSDSAVAASVTEPVVIAHISDVHRGWDNLKRFIEFTWRYSFDARILTGDIVESGYTTTQRDEYAGIDGVERIMCVIGNHDTSHYYQASGETKKTHHWQEYVGTTVYNAFIAPYVSGWGVTQPDGAEQNGYCYYYKDFAEKKMRLVCVDIMGFDATENTWLASVMEGARVLGYHVLIATHYAGSRRNSEKDMPVFDKISCSYSTNTTIGTSSSTLTPYNTNAYLMTGTVDDFIDNGGKFVGYMQGHYHRDFVAKVSEARNLQLIYSIDTGRGLDADTADFTHLSGTRNIDSFQIIAIDTYSNLVRLYKVGAQIDRFCKKHEMLCINYTTGKVLSEIADAEKRFEDYESRIATLEAKIAQLEIS